MTAYLVGAGPGDKGLMTARSLELIARADVILFDKLIPDGALDGARADAELVDVGKIGGGAQVPQETTNELCCCATRRPAARSCGSRAATRSSSGAAARRRSCCAPHGLDFEVVPGVTAGVAAPAYAGIPVTQRGVSAAVAFVTGHEDPAKPDTLIDWPALAAFPGTLVFYMGVRSLDRIASQLVAGGRPHDQPVAVVQRGTFADQRTVGGTLANIARLAAEAGVRGAGDHGRRRRRRDARRDRMVRGRTIGRPHGRRDAGAGPGEPARRPAARARRERRRGARDPHRAARRDAARPVGVRPAVRDEPQRRAAPARAAAATRATCAARRSPRSDPGTADALRAGGIEADIVPARAVAESLVEALAGLPVRRALIARAEQARELLPDALRERGAEVEILRALSHGRRAARRRGPRGRARRRLRDVHLRLGGALLRRGRRAGRTSSGSSRSARSRAPRCASRASSRGSRPAEHTPDGLVAALRRAAAHGRTDGPLSSRPTLARRWPW